MTRRLSTAALLAVLVTACTLVPPTQMPAPTPVPVPSPTPSPVPPPPIFEYVGRTGPVRAIGSSFADDQGEFNALGTSLFWALWGERNDPAKLDRNLAFARAQGLDYIRILGMVGSGMWADRRIDPKAADYWTTVDALFGRLARHGLRAQVTVFADADAMMPDREDRRAFVDAWAAKAQARRERVLYLETVNEHWQNGLADVDELRELTRRMNERTDVQVAASSPSCGSHPEGGPDEWTPAQRDCVAQWQAIYGSGAADLITFHFDRDVSKADGAWRPVRQPWETQYGAFSTGVKRYVNAEPIGPESSVASDDDPERLTMAAVTTWLSRGAGYTLHTGAGISGGGAVDIARGRSPDLDKVRNISTTLGALKKLRAVLPPMANCSPKNNNANFPDRPMTVYPLEGFIRAYQTVCGDRVFVVTVFGLKGAGASLQMLNGVADVKWYRWTGEELGAAAMSPTTVDGSITIGPVAESVIVVGTYRR